MIYSPYFSALLFMYYERHNMKRLLIGKKFRMCTVFTVEFSLAIIQLNAILWHRGL